MEVNKHISFLKERLSMSLQDKIDIEELLLNYCKANFFYQVVKKMDLYKNNIQKKILYEFDENNILLLDDYKIPKDFTEEEKNESIKSINESFDNLLKSIKICDKQYKSLKEIVNDLEKKE